MCLIPVILYMNTGICESVGSSPMLILELMEYGNLLSFVKSHGCVPVYVYLVHADLLV